MKTTGTDWIGAEQMAEMGVHISGPALPIDIVFRSRKQTLVIVQMIHFCARVLRSGGVIGPVLRTMSKARKSAV